MSECGCEDCERPVLDGELQPLIRDGGMKDQELHPLSDTNRWLNKCPTSGYTHVRSVLDSGATDSCAPDSMCPEVPSQEYEGSRRGQMYTAAGGKKLANEGEKMCVW